MASCKSCGNDVTGLQFCANCGTPVEQVAQTPVMDQQPVQGQPVEQPVQAQPVQAQPVQGQPVVPGQAAPAAQLPNDNLGIAGFVCGIVGALCCTYVAIPGLICSILSMNNVKAGKVNPKNKWMGIVGLILSIIGIITMIINIISIISGTNAVYNDIYSSIVNGL